MASIGRILASPRPDVNFGGKRLMAQGRTIRVVAVKGGRIAALGAGPAPPGAERLEFPRGCVCPGFWDTHLHVAMTGAAVAGPWLHDARSIREIVERLADHARQHPEAAVVVGRAANLDPATLAEGRLPTAADLDRAERHRPVLLADVNKCVGNTAALAAAGLTAATPDPAGGRLERGADGEATGVAWFAAKGLLERLVPPGRASFADRFAAGLDALAARGVVVAVEGSASLAEVEAIRRLDAEGRLACRVVVQPSASSEDAAAALAASGLEFGQELGPRSRVGPAKVFYDRFVMHRTARMSRPYEGEPEDTGGYFNDPAALRARLRAAMDDGFPVAVHVTGDAGMDELLDALGEELGRRGGAAPRGSFLIHGYFPPERGPERMAELGLGLAAQPAFLHRWADTLERFVGRERTEGFYPLARYLAAGVVVGAGSDSAIADFDPLLGLHAATTRRSASGRLWGAAHALTMEQALALYTDSAARLLGWSGLSGRLAVGEAADFVVLDRDPASTPPEQVRDIQVLATYVAGRRTWPR
jgi:predicted amidohydrolase YtcJ